VRDSFVFCRILFQPDLPVYVAIKGVVFDVSEARSKIFLRSLPVGYNTHALNISRVFDPFISVLNV